MYTQLSVFWTISAIQLFYLSYSLPKDEDAMDAELARYAATALAKQQQVNGKQPPLLPSPPPPQIPKKALAEEDVSIEDRMRSWDAGAARESMHFVGTALKEIGDEIKTIRPLSIRCADFHLSDEEEAEDSALLEESENSDTDRRRQAWIRQQHLQEDMDADGPTERTRLV
jgi:hypothetical protein